MGEYVHDFRHLINLMEYQEPIKAPVAPEPDQEVDTVNIEERIKDIIFKLRAHSSPVEGEEAGCEMAAGMLENLLRQLGETSQ